MNPMALLTPLQTSTTPPPLSSRRPSSMLMSSGVHSSDVSLPSKNPEKKGQKRERKPNLPSFFSHPGLLLCAVQLAVTLDPLTLTPQRQAMPTLDDDDSGSDREDELPQVVVLKGGDLTAEDVKKMKGATRSGGETEGERASSRPHSSPSSSK